jgi:hypothetical protein
MKSIYDSKPCNYLFVASSSPASYIRSLLIGMLKPWITSSPSEVTSADALAWHFLVSMGPSMGL